MAFRSATGPSNSPSPFSTSAPTENPTTTMELFDSIARGSHPSVKADAQTAEPAKKPTKQTQPREEAQDEPELQEEATDTEIEDGHREDDEGIDATSDAERMVVKGAGKTREFVLNKDNKELRQVLAAGMQYPHVQKELKTLRAENAALKSSQPQGDSYSKFQEAQELIEAGFTNSAIKLLLGDDKYKSYYNGEVAGRLAFEEATPEERIKIMQDRHDTEKRELQWRLERTGKKKEADQKSEIGKKEDAQAIILAKAGKQLLATLDFSYAGDELEQEDARQDVWALADRDLAKHVERYKKQGKDITITRDLLEKALRHNYEKLTSSRKPGTSNKASKEKAAEAASRNYKGVKEDKLKGMSLMDKFKALGGK